MADFEEVEYGYNQLDETINFGTRILADGNNLHETCTVATFVNTDEDIAVEDVHINTLKHLNQICISTNKSMKILQQKDCTVCFMVTFESIVDCFSVSDDNKYLLLCFRSGTVRIFDITSEEPLLIYTSNLSENFYDKEYYCNSFLESSDKSALKFLVINKRGKITRVCIDKKCPELVEEGSEKLEETASEVEVYIEDVFDYMSEINFVAFNYPMLILCGTYMVANVDIEEQCLISEQNLSLVKVIQIELRALLGLQKDRQLIRINSIIMSFFETEMDNFYKDIVCNNKDVLEGLFAVTKNDELGNSFIQCLTYPDFEIKYSIKMKETVHLIAPESLNEEVMFVSEIRKAGLIKELRLCQIYETEPEKRLARLIRKQALEEAEAFAKFFNIDPAIVNKAKADLIVDKCECSSKDIKLLIETLDTLSDIDFKVLCCQGVHYCCVNYEDVKTVLDYGCSFASHLKNSDDDSSVLWSNLKFLTNTLYRFETFLAIYTPKNYNMDMWMQFYQCELLEELKDLLHKYQIDEAIILYGRLDEKAIKTLDVEEITKILDILNILPVGVYQKFIPTFIPISLRYVPSSLPVFVKWLHNKIYQMEKRYASNFPENALKFADQITKLLKVDLDTSFMQFKKQSILNRNELLKLESLLKCLKGMGVLKNNFRLNIPLATYLQGPQAVIRCLLNINLNSAEYDILLENFLCPLILEHDLNQDAVLYEEIENMMQFAQSSWVNTIGSLLKYINSVEVKLQAIKLILDSALVPWCDNVREIALSALKYTHSLTPVIRKIVEFEPLKVVLNKPKYKIKDKTINTMEDFIFTVNRMIYCNDKNMIEDVYKLCNTPLRRHEANLILIKHFLENGDTQKALGILDNNTPEEIKKCTEILATFSEFPFSEELPSSLKQISPVDYDTLGSFHKRRTLYTSDCREKSDIENHFTQLSNCYSISKTFNKTITMSQLSSKAKKAALLDELIAESVEEFETGRLDVAEIYPICSKIATSLDLNKEEVAIKFCNSVENFKVILNLAGVLYENCDDCKYLCLISILLMKFVGHLKVALPDFDKMNLDNTFVVPSFVENCDKRTDNENNLAGLGLVEKIMTKALLFADDADLGACLEIIAWSESGFYLTRNYAKDVLNDLTKGTYYGVATAPSITTFSTFRNVFNNYCNFVGQYKYLENKYLTYFNKDSLIISQERFVQEIENLPLSINNLCCEGQFITAYKLLSTLKNSLIMYSSIINLEILKKHDVFRNDVLEKMCMRPLLQSIISANHVDCNLLFNLLLVCDVEYAKAFLYSCSKIYKRQPRKFSTIAEVGLRLLDYYKLSSGNNVWKKIFYCCKWWKKLENCSSKPGYDAFFRENEIVLAEQLILHDCFDIDDIKNYSADFKLDAQIYYVFFLKKTLLNWDVQYEIVTEVTGERNLVIKSLEDDLAKKCTDVIELIENKHLVLEILSNIWGTVNFYHYEVFLTIINIMQKIKPSFKYNNNDLLTLSFYKSYKRINKPNKHENELWFTIFPKTQTIDPLSEFRLPFIQNLFSDYVLKIIHPEITLATYENWFIGTNSLNKNDICTYVVNNIVASGVLNSDKNEEWCLNPKHEHLFNEIDKCVQNIDDIEKATSALYLLFINTPKGADQVNAVRICYKYALKYKIKQPSADVEKAFIKVQTKFFIHSTIHVLHIYKLADQKYIDLVANPEQLITALYHDQRIITDSESINVSTPDINKAVTAVADLYESINLRNIQSDLLKGWLLDSFGSMEFDSTKATFDVVAKTDHSRCGDDNLKRAYYLCSGSEMSYWIVHLLRIADGSDEETSLSLKARALKVICTIADIGTISQYISVSYNEFVEHMEQLTLLSELSKIGFTLERKNVMDFNKGLMNHLALQVNPTSIRIMANLCISHTNYDMRYWKYIISHSVRLKMINDLKQYVHFLKNQPCLYRNFYLNAWQVIIEEAFFNPPSLMGTTDELHGLYLDNFIILIQSCPVIFRLNLERVFYKCVQVGKFDFAAFLLQFLPAEKRSECGQVVLQSDSILKDVDKLAEEGLWGVNNVKSILSSLECSDLSKSF